MEKLLAALADALGHLQEIFSALLDIERGPFRLRLLGGGDRFVYVGGVAGDKLAEPVLVGRIDRLDPLVGLAGDHLATDQHVSLHRGVHVHDKSPGWAAARRTWR